MTICAVRKYARAFAWMNGTSTALARRLVRRGKSLPDDLPTQQGRGIGGAEFFNEAVPQKFICDDVRNDPSDGITNHHLAKRIPLRSLQLWHCHDKPDTSFFCKVSRKICRDAIQAFQGEGDSDPGWLMGG